MKKHLAGNRYQTDYDVISAVEDFFEGQEENFYTFELQAQQHRWKKYVNRRGDYPEKYMTFGQIYVLQVSQAINFSTYPCKLIELQKCLLFQIGKKCKMSTLIASFVVLTL